MSAPRGEPTAAPRGRQLIFVGYRCNNRCVFCAQGDLAREEAEPPDVVSQLERARAEGAEAVAFVGGEPTLHGELFAWIGAARELGSSSILVQTNGRRLTYAAYARELAAAGADAIEVSLAGPRTDVHDYHTRVPDSWKQSAAGIRAAVAAGLPVTITSPVTRSSFRHLRELVRTARQLGAAALHLALPRARGATLASFSRIVPRLGLVTPHLGAAFGEGVRARLPVVVSGAPLCALPRFEHAALELHGGGAGDGVYGDACAACGLRSRCPGVDPAYARLVGHGELASRPAREDLDAAAAAYADAASGVAGIGWVAPAGEALRPEPGVAGALDASPGDAGPRDVAAASRAAAG